VMNFRAAQYLVSAFHLVDLPVDVGREVAFVGRSNSGKSSAINALTGIKRLAYTSKTPGRTQTINCFDLGDDCRLADLPGYGFARVSKDMLRHWQQALADYFVSRKSLVGGVLLMDIRHPLREVDDVFLSLAGERQLPVRVLLTKADKLKRDAANQVLFKVEKALKGVAAPVSVQLFSSVRGDGLDDFKVWLEGRFV